MSSSFTEIVEDIEGGGLHNTLLIKVSLDVLKEATYLIVGELHDKAGQQITWSKSTALLSTGEQTIELAFDGKEIFASGIDGPYYLNNLTLWLEEGDYKLDELKNAYVTGAYSHRQFQRDKIDISSDSISDQGIDINGNGKFDFLEIKFNLT